MGPFSIEEVLAAEAEALKVPEQRQLVAELSSRGTSQAAETNRLNKDADRRSGKDETEDAVDNRKAFYCTLNKLNRAALCCSGGGIRSATFCLGVIQALASHRLKSSQVISDPKAASKRITPAALLQEANGSLLSCFHYLSTVSGGGYIGSWLSAWRTRDDFATVWQSLTSRPDGPDVEPAELSWLRAYSNYLTPTVGLASADTWTGIAIYLRNLILNWLVIVPAVAFVLLALKFAISGAVAAARLDDMWWSLQLIFALVGIACLVVAHAYTTKHRPTRRLPPRVDPCEDPNNIKQKDFLLKGLIWSFASAFFLTGALTSSVSVHMICGDIIGAPPACSVETHTAIIVGAVIGVLTFAVGWLVGNPLHWRCNDLVRWAASGLVYGGLVGYGAHLYAGLMPYSGDPKDGVKLILLPVILGVPWILVAQLFAEMVFVGLVSYQPNSDADREWLGRAAGWVAATAVAWILVTFITFAGGYLLIDYLYGKVIAPYLVSAGGISGIITAWLGKSAKTPAKPSGEKPSAMTTAYNVGLAIAGPLFAAILIVGISVGLDLLLLGHSLIGGLATKAWSYWYIFAWLIVGLIATFVVAWISSHSVNINRFSIHALYRNRLVRAYLGATRQRRCPDAFTGFDNDDNIAASKLWPPKPPGQGSNTFCLFHVVNITLNVVKATRLAWQQRKAESFTVSALHSGAAYKGFRLSKEYGGGTSPDGISLGTAMAISGAAASPNMGYHSSPSITLLLALFNVRLGWWLGNPGAEGESTYKEEGPLTAIRPLVEETFGLTTDEKPWVYLSDGGHFENLGLYEMVRRRCRFIVAIDAGCDPNFAFEDLGNAVRKIFIDLGVRIEFQGLNLLRNRPGDKEDGDSIPYHAIGRVHYAAADGADCKDGWVLYIKPAIHFSRFEGAGVRSYATANKTFPHETTGDQWFTESQFESYRALGLDITNTILSGEVSLNEDLTLNELLTELSPTHL